MQGLPTRSRTAHVARTLRLALRRTGLVLALAVGASCSDGGSKLTVTGLKPKLGPYIGGDPVTISGSGFQTPGPQGLKVYFGKKEARGIILVSDTEVRVEPPAGEIDSTVDVEVVFDDARSAKLPKAYTYIDPIGGMKSAPAAAPPPN